MAILFVSCKEEIPWAEDSDVPSHKPWTFLLEKHVSENGSVDYEGFQNDIALLDMYLNKISKNAPSKKWSKEDQLAYWLNAYNAFVIKLVLNHYPIKRIRDVTLYIPFINTPWDIEFIPLNNQKVDLNFIEHKVLRKVFKEPRIHFALVCASKSCPSLRREAYEGARVRDQLQEDGINFINDSKKTSISEDRIVVSPIFSWFKEDFNKDGSLIDFINGFSNVEIRSDAEIEYLEYDWSLNSF
ncbi:MAG: DUF547 domain-containing protein [Bacteroidota bacterium]